MKIFPLYLPSVLFLFAVAAFCPIAGQESSVGIDEDELFSDTATVIKTDSVVDNIASKLIREEKKTVACSGRILSTGLLSANRDAFTSTKEISYTTASTSIVADAMVDIRLLAGIKAFASLETIYVPDSIGSTFFLRELFVDFNWNKKIYLRTGKQVLQWGRCFFWNPSDLINVEKKLFVPRIGFREGAYGLKVHIPYKTRFNAYGFIDTKGMQKPTDAAYCAKLETLVATTECAVAFWYKFDKRAVYTADVSTNIFHVNLYSEMSLSRGGNTARMETVSDTLVIVSQSSKWIPRVSLSIFKNVDFMQIKNRLMLIAEAYYNHAGYTGNIFGDRRTYVFAQPLAVPGTPQQQLSQGTKKMFLLGHNLYEANSLSRWYGAASAIVNKFVLSDVTLTVSVMGNFVDHSAVVSTTIGYQTINDCTFQLTINGFLGRENREYTFADEGFIQQRAVTAQLTAGISF
ncbi:MAG: hypothetical protein JW795_11090 [Chitinivibrionales bacterium]|nr:hypothetical protein [Chitinivibrionales bacterium]